MKRNLITQMKNEWRSNIWLIVELVVVVLAIWTIVSYMYAVTEGLRIPQGFDRNDVYSLSLKQLKKDSPDYVPVSAEDYAQMYYDDYAEILRRLRANPNVEAVATVRGMEIYTLNYAGTSLVPAEGDSVYYSANQLYASPEIVDVLRLRSLTGSAPEQLKEMLSRGELLTSDNPAYEQQGRDAMTLKGREMYLGGDTTKVWRVGDVVQRIRRTDYENSFGGILVQPIAADNPWGDVLIRMKPGRGKAFEQDFNSKAELRGVRNIYFADLQSFDEKRFIVQYDTNVSLRTLTMLGAFMLVTIFLGLLGTFWFRMQQRTQEIAIRMVSGATRGQIFRRILGEGMILLGVAAVIASACVWPFQFNGSLAMIGIDSLPLLLLELCALAFVALGIVLSLWYPAVRAMRVEPAIAIKDE